MLAKHGLASNYLLLWCENVYFRIILSANIYSFSWPYLWNLKTKHHSRIPSIFEVINCKLNNHMQYACFVEGTMIQISWQNGGLVLLQFCKFQYWRRLDELRFEFSEPPRSIEANVRPPSSPFGIPLSGFFSLFCKILRIGTLRVYSYSEFDLLLSRAGWNSQ